MRFRRPAEVSRGARVAGLAGTAVVHGTAVLLLVLAARAGAGAAPVVYSVELVAAPLPTEAARATSTAPSPPAPPVVAPKPAKKAIKAPTPKAPPKVDPKVAPAPPVKTPVRPVPGATPGTGTDVDNVRVDGGKVFPHPEYLRNLMNEILRRWARPAGAAALEAEVSFTIFRDGSVRDIKVVRSSRSYAFDLEAQGAVEQAATDRAFGPLPKDWPSDILQVAFLFTPRKPQ